MEPKDFNETAELDVSRIRELLAVCRLVGTVEISDAELIRSAMERDKQELMSIGSIGEVGR